MLRNLKELKHFLGNYFFGPCDPYVTFDSTVVIWHKCHVSGVLMKKSGWNRSKHVEAISLRSVARRKKERRKKKRVRYNTLPVTRQGKNKVICWKDVPWAGSWIAAMRRHFSHEMGAGSRVQEQHDGMIFGHRWQCWLSSSVIDVENVL